MVERLSEDRRGGSVRRTSSIDIEALAADPATVRFSGRSRDALTRNPGEPPTPIARALVRASDLIASVPERHTGCLRDGMHSFPLPFATPEITVSLLWHPRMDGDPAHCWLRRCLRDACAEALAGPGVRSRG